MSNFNTSSNSSCSGYMSVESLSSFHSFSSGLVYVSVTFPRPLFECWLWMKFESQGLPTVDFPRRTGHNPTRRAPRRERYKLPLKEGPSLSGKGVRQILVLTGGIGEVTRRRKTEGRRGEVGMRWNDQT